MLVTLHRPSSYSVCSQPTFFFILSPLVSFPLALLHSNHHSSSLLLSLPLVSFCLQSTDHPLSHSSLPPKPSFPLPPPPPPQFSSGQAPSVHVLSWFISHFHLRSSFQLLFLFVCLVIISHFTSYLFVLFFAILFPPSSLVFIYLTSLFPSLSNPIFLSPTFSPPSACHPPTNLPLLSSSLPTWYS